MVEDTRKAGGSGDIRPLNQPVVLQVRADDEGIPMSLKLRGKWLEVESVEDRWRIEDEWWRDQPVDRMYFTCVVDGGIKVTVFQDTSTMAWYWQRT